MTDMSVIPESGESVRYPPTNRQSMSSSYDRGMRRMQQQRSLDEVAQMLQHSVNGDGDRISTGVDRHHSFGQIGTFN
jgi:hypothetical protein